MINLNSFLENTLSEDKTAVDYDLDEKAVYNNIIKMSEFLFSEDSLIAKSCLNEYNFDTIDFDIVLVDDIEIQRINKEYRKKDSPTDVITFAMFADSDPQERYILDGEISLGEIIVSVDRINVQSKENNVGFNEELYYIISHGILHLLGFDHLTEDDYNFMVEW